MTQEADPRCRCSKLKTEPAPDCAWHNARSALHPGDIVQFLQQSIRTGEWTVRSLAGREVELSNSAGALILAYTSAVFLVRPAPEMVPRGPAPCDMTHTPPFDFAQCNTHDTTFPLGSKCEWDGVESVAEHLQEKVDEQRRQKVQAKIRLEQIAELCKSVGTGTAAEFAAEILELLS